MKYNLYIGHIPYGYEYKGTVEVDSEDEANEYLFDLVNEEYDSKIGDTDEEYEVEEDISDYFRYKAIETSLDKVSEENIFMLN